jgi:hypothetical protein
VPEFVNSSLHATIPLATLAVTAWLVTLLFVSPDATAIAFTVALDIMRNGARYGVEAAVGVVPSVV